MLNKLTVVDKINKTLAYCNYTKQLATNAGNEVRYLVEIENAGLETEQLCDSRTLHSAIYRAVIDARWNSQNYNCLSSVKVYIETYNSEGDLIDEDPIDEYEINFENGIEVR